MAIHSSTIAWKIPWTEEPVRLQSMGSQRHDWATSLSLLWHCLKPLVASHFIQIGSPCSDLQGPMYSGCPPLSSLSSHIGPLFLHHSQCSCLGDFVLHALCSKASPPDIFMVWSFTSFRSLLCVTLSERSSLTTSCKLLPSPYPVILALTWFYFSL